jgi:hypothetical protein
LDELGKALELYSECVKKISSYENKIENQIKIYSFYNMGLIYYDTDQFLQAKNNLEHSLEFNRKENYNIDDEISSIILETLGEMEIEFRKYDEALKHLKEALDIRKKKNLHKDKISLKRISFLINFIYDQYNYKATYEQNFNTGKFSALSNFNSNNKIETSGKSENNLHKDNSFNFHNKDFSKITEYNYDNNDTKNNNLSSKIMGKDLLNNSSNFMKKHFKIDEEIENDANFNHNFNNFFQSNMHLLNQSYRNLGFKVNDKDTEAPKDNNSISVNNTKLKEEELDEIEKFFIFLTQLSAKEIEILNEDQKHTEKNIPIFFSEVFKNCLTYGQKIKLLEMKFMKLRRNIILKNPNGKIEVDNLNYEILERKNTNKKIENSVQKYYNKLKMENWANNSMALTKEKFNLNDKEIYLFLGLKDSLLKYLNGKSYKNNDDKSDFEMPPDKKLSDYIKETDEEEIRYFIENPQYIFNSYNEIEENENENDDVDNYNDDEEGKNKLE